MSDTITVQDLEELSKNLKQGDDPKWIFPVYIISQERLDLLNEVSGTELKYGSKCFGMILVEPVTHYWGS